MRTLTTALFVLGIALTQAGDAAACGCFTPPDPSVPIVQAGERILFAMSGGQVTAHIQIQYKGTAQDFGWLLPLPSVPTLDVGTDELFATLINTTQPKYDFQRVYAGNCGFNRGGGALGNGAPTAGAGGSGGGGGSGDTASSPLVYQDSIGPYDYAVLKADSKDAMLAWLSTNRYFVPAGTDDAVGPYIHPGAFFLALKLKKGNDVGDLQPVVVHYASDLPMIPIVLTSVAAQPDMGIQVWMLGPGRAIPRNYYHTVINDAKIDWLGYGKNYNDVIIAATKEAEGRHTFVTEFAGSSSRMQGQLNSSGRFGNQADLAAQPSDLTFVSYMLQHSYPLTAQTVAVLQKYIPVPAIPNITPAQFYANLGYYLGSYRTQNPSQFTGWTENFQPAMMAQDLQDRVVGPTLAAGALFDQLPYLTRLYTTLSPENMNKDPVFSFNVGLPDYSNTHNATLTYHCNLLGTNDDQSTTPATLTTESGWAIDFPGGTGSIGGTYRAPAGPSSQRIEILREQGAPEVVTDNTSRISNALDSGGGCGVGVGGGRASRNVVGAFGLVALAALVLMRRKRA